MIACACACMCSIPMRTRARMSETESRRDMRTVPATPCVTNGMLDRHFRAYCTRSDQCKADEITEHQERSHFERIVYVHCSYVLQHSCWHASKQSARSSCCGPGAPCFRGTQSLRQLRYRPSFLVPSGLSLLVGLIGSLLPLIHIRGGASAKTGMGSNENTSAAAVRLCVEICAVG